MPSFVAVEMHGPRQNAKNRRTRRKNTKKETQNKMQKRIVAMRPSGARAGLAARTRLA
jgi:hypothetical protein